MRNKKFYIAPMSVEEAILQMNLLEHEFFVFRTPKHATHSPWSTNARTAATVLSRTTRTEKTEQHI